MAKAPIRKLTLRKPKVLIKRQPVKLTTATMDLLQKKKLISVLEIKSNKFIEGSLQKKSEQKLICNIYLNAEKEIAVLKSKLPNHPEIRGLLGYLEGYKGKLFRDINEFVNNYHTHPVDFINLAITAINYDKTKTSISTLLQSTQGNVIKGKGKSDHNPFHH